MKTLSTQVSRNALTRIRNVRSLEEQTVRNLVITKLCQLLVWVCMVMFMGLRTGEMFDTSTARFAIMTTATLFQDYPPPQVAGQFEEFFR